MFMLPNGHPKLLQIFSARYLEFVPEKTLNVDVSLIFYMLPLKVFAKLYHIFNTDK